jgi:hypothetical protein
MSGAWPTPSGTGSSLCSSGALTFGCAWRTAATRRNGAGLLSRPRIVLREQRVNRAEGALVDGRHPGPIKLSPLTRRRWRRAWRLVAAEVGRKATAVRGGSRQRVSEATSHARFAVENTVTGSVCRRGCRSQLRQDREAPCSGGIWGQNPHATAEQVTTKPKLEGRRQAKLHLEWRCTGGPRGSEGGAPGIDGSAGCSCRRSVAEVGRRIFFELGSVRREASRISAR